MKSDKTFGRCNCLVVSRFFSLYIHTRGLPGLPLPTHSYPDDENRFELEYSSNQAQINGCVNTAGKQKVFVIAIISFIRLCVNLGQYLVQSCLINLHS